MPSALDSMDELMLRAERALLSAKEAGSDSVGVAQPTQLSVFQLSVGCAAACRAA